MINFPKSLAAWVSASPPQEGNSNNFKSRAELKKLCSCLEKSISPTLNKGKKEHTSSLDNPDYQRKVWTI